MDAPVRWRLRIEGPDGKARSVPVSRDLIVGRDAEADLRVDDSSVSRKHAQLLLDANGVLQIEDLGSANGVLVDDSRIGGKVKVRPGAVLKLGLYTLTAERLMDATIERPSSKDRPGPKGTEKQPVTGADDAEEEVLPSQPVLRFKNGPTAGKDIPLIRREIVLGRIAEGNDIIVPDESISRRHAELIRVGRGYEVKDLQSVNGTSVNGERIVSQPLRAGDRLKFGMIEADYLGPNAESAKPLDRRLLRRIIILCSSVLLLLLVFEGFQAWRVHLARLRSDQHTDEEDTSSVEKSLVEAQNARRDERWEHALQAYQEALAQDPVNPDARKGIREVKDEIEMKITFDKARQRVDVGQDEEGVEIYLRISASSIYYPRARAEVHRLADLLKRRYDEQCRQSQREGDQQGTLLSCSHYLNLVCNSVLDEARLKAVRAAEQKLGAKNKNPAWSCPPTSARWFSDDAIATSGSLGQRIGLKYKNQQLAQIVRIYANGQPRQAMNMMGTLKLSPAEAHDPELDRLQKQIELAYGAYNDGVSALGTGDWRTAKRQWDTFLEIDKQILPQGDESTLATDARNQLAKQFFKMGNDLFIQTRFEDAYRTWDQGFAINPNDNDINQGFILLEDQANKLVTEGSSCADLVQALNITRATSFNHKRATQIAREHKCRW